MRIRSAIVITGLVLLSWRTISAAPAPTDACTLLTPAHVGSVLGVAVGAGEHVLPSNPLMCGWGEPNDRAHRGKRVVLDVFGPLGQRSPTDRYNTAATPVPGIEKTPVTGIGDAAFYATTPGIGITLTVRKGASVFQVRVTGFPADETKVKEKTLAGDVLAKL
jgi:hypothetical protein